MIGVLLVNLGTPDAPDTASVRRYLAEFLSDRRVIEIPQIAWQPILRGFILTTRPAKSAKAYREVWTNEGSPLMAISMRQTAKLRERLGDALIVAQAMRYGTQSIRREIARLVVAGCDRILFAPLYPQYCAATTASSQDALFKYLASQRSQPAIRTLPPYFDDPLYIDALRANIERQLGDLDFEPERLLLSFHGMPERTRQLGDPYYDQCMATARLLGEVLDQRIDVAFQSRFGPARWLEPATEPTLQAYPGKGVKKVAIAAPGFSADCLETIEELGIRGRDAFIEAGGTQFARLDCLNDSAEGMTMLTALVARELEGWVRPT
ncbi:MAG: ferrochelatase [Sphingomonas sp.]|nr:ferrochelatase [Sphingomonas sp.]